MTRSEAARTTVLDDAKFLQPDEAARLRDHLEDEIAAAFARGGNLRLRNAVLGQVLLGTGLRISEAVALRCGDLVLDGPRRMVRVRHGKGDKSRDVTIGADLRNLLRRYLGASATRQDDDEVDAPLFPAGAGTRCMSRISGWRVWKAYLRALGLDAEGRGCHAARHTRATLLYAATRDLRLVGRELGHSDMRTTAIYADVLAEDRAAAADAIDDRLRAVSTTPNQRTTRMKRKLGRPKQTYGQEAGK